MRRNKGREGRGSIRGPLDDQVLDIVDRVLHRLDFIEEILRGLELPQGLRQPRDLDPVSGILAAPGCGLRLD